MAHRRRPPNAIRHYGVLVGSVVEGFQSSDGSSPHYEIHVKGGDRDYRIAVNVQSVDDSEVLAYFDAEFAKAGTLDLKPYLDGDPGFRRLETGPSGQGGLDYVRDNIFPVDAMRPIPATGGVSLKNLLDANIKRATADQNAMVVAFGEYFEDPGQTDKYFHFRPERGIHDIHMMQGNSGQFAGDNRTHGDGALFLCFGKTAEIVALFVRFQTQSLNTDDNTGAPRH
ncbi:DUF2278 family protein [Bradyrhizobium liaoningense]|uniref:DUF2278 family protein n=1 Tax=Bradyrhizobium liaoningense TaxID=43992 RepID=UPI001BAD63C4|nr:DUF2278 family protein [Bradyrhizobium liaoningense]MBR0713428.1 DUF2278 family protein [Bradyrhizobium liaoningense]